MPSLLFYMSYQVRLVLEYVRAVERGELPHNHEIMRQVCRAIKIQKFNLHLAEMCIVDSGSFSPVACARAWQVQTRVLHTGLQTFYLCHKASCLHCKTIRYMWIVFLVQRCGSDGSAGVSHEVCQQPQPVCQQIQHGSVYNSDHRSFRITDKLYICKWDFNRCYLQVYQKQGMGRRMRGIFFWEHHYHQYLWHFLLVVLADMKRFLIIQGSTMCFALICTWL